ncbi:hypothetical protein Tco_0701057 [Tanacetum coccineum]
MGDENPIRTLRDYSKPSHGGYRNTIKLPIGNNVVPLRSDTIRSVQKGYSFQGLRSEDPNQHLKDFLKLIDSLDLDGDNRERMRLQDLTLYDNESWNDPKDFAKPFKAIALPQDVPSASDRRLIELENQVQCLMETYLALTQTSQVNKVSYVCEICNGPHDTQCCMENPKQAFVDYASLRTNKAGGQFTIHPKQPEGSQVNRPNERQEEDGNLGNTNPNPHTQPDPLASIATEHVRKLNLMLKSLGLVPQSSNTKFVCSKDDDGEVMFIEIIRDDDEPQNEDPTKGEGTTIEGTMVEYFDTLPTRDKLTYHKYLMCGPIPSIFLRNSIITEGCPTLSKKLTLTLTILKIS